MSRYTIKLRVCEQFRLYRKFKLVCFLSFIYSELATKVKKSVFEIELKNMEM